MIFLSPSGYFDKLKKYAPIIDFLYASRESGALPLSDVSDNLGMEGDAFEEAVSTLTDYGIIYVIEDTVYLNDSLQRHLEETLGASVHLNGSYKDLFEELQESVRYFNMNTENREHHYRKIVTSVGRIPKDIEVKLNHMTRQKQAIMDIEETKEKLDKINKHYRYLMSVIAFIEEFIAFFDDPAFKENVMGYTNEQSMLLERFVKSARNYLSISANRHIRHDINDIIEFINNIRTDLEFHRKISQIHTLMRNGTFETSSNFSEIFEQHDIQPGSFQVYRRLDYAPLREDATLDEILIDVAGVLKLEKSTAGNGARQNVDRSKGESPAPVKTFMINRDAAWKAFSKQSTRHLFRFIFSMEFPNGSPSPAERFSVAAHLYQAHYNELQTLEGPWWKTTIWSTTRGRMVPYLFPKVILKDQPQRQ